MPRDMVVRWSDVYMAEALGKIGKKMVFYRFLPWGRVLLPRRVVDVDVGSDAAESFNVG